MRRSLAITSVLAAVALTVPTAAFAGPASAPSPYRADDYADGQAMAILPPGANGLTTSTQLATFELTANAPGASRTVDDDSAQYPANARSQLAKYDHLTYAGSAGTDRPAISDATLGSYYEDESFGVKPADVTKTVTNPGGQDVTILYDTLAIPHVYGADDDAMAFGAGYAQASERLFFMDVLRHYGEGQTAAFVGSSCADFRMDQAQLLLAPYTPAEAQAQVDALPTEYGAQGARTRAMIYAFKDGINAYIAAAKADPTNLLPAEYAALPTASSTGPSDWSVGDVVAIAGLIGGIFGKGGGNEVNDAALYEYLVAKLGTADGQRAYADFKSQNDPDAPTTIVDRTFPYQPSNTTPSATLNDLPAVGADHQVHLTGQPDTYPTGSTCGTAAPSTPVNPAATPTQKAQVEALGAIASLAELPKAFSNALVVDAKHSADGHPIAVFGPQVSYFAPQILMQEDLHSPTYAATGVSFPGTGVVELGRGEDFAWSATSAGSDLIDQRLLQTCGGDQYHYLHHGQCLAMAHDDFTETATPTVGGPGVPGTVTHSIYRTADKAQVIQGWTTDTAGHQVAVSTERSTYNHDVDSVIGFVDWGTPSATYDVTSWMHGATEIGFTFNWFYVDDRDAGYYVSGLDPIRPAGADTNLPLSSDADWQGFLSADAHPHEVNPAKGYFVSWNNKPAPGFSAADEQFGYGSTYRSTMLTDQLDLQLANHGGLVHRADVVQAMATAATQDLDGLTEVKALLAYLAAHKNLQETATEKQMVDLLTTWVATGAHRHKKVETDTQYDQAAAVAISDELVPLVIRAIWDPLLAAGGVGGVGNNGGAADPGYTIVPAQWTNTPHSGGANLGSAYDAGWEGYVQDDFRQLAGQPVGQPFASAVTDTWCGSGPASCPTAIWGALSAAATSMAAANGGSTDASTWLYDSETKAVPASLTNPSGTAATPMPVWDAIHFRAVGIVGVPAVDWQNRPTYQQVIEFPRHRARSTSPTTPGGGASASGPGGLAATGGLPYALLALVLVAAGSVPLLRRRRR